MKKLPNNASSSDEIVSALNRAYKVNEKYEILEWLLTNQKVFPLGDMCQYFLNNKQEFCPALGQTPALQYNFMAAYRDKLPHSNTYRDVNGATPAVVSNERDVKSTLEKLSNTKPCAVKKGVARVGMMVADAHVLSMLPDLNVDIMLLADFDTLVTKNILFQLLCLKKATSYFEFMCLYATPTNNPVILAKIPTKNMSGVDAISGKSIYLSFLF